MRRQPRLDRRDLRLPPCRGSSTRSTFDLFGIVKRIVDAKA
jgi:hypothetical protein